MRVIPVVVVVFLSTANQNKNHVDAFHHTSILQRPLASSRLYNSAPQLNHWRVLPEGKIRGVISGHPVIPDGDMVTTSPILDLDHASTDKLVQTNSGSQYILKTPQGTQVIQKVRGTQQLKGTQKIGSKPAPTSSGGGVSAVAVPILGGVLVALGATTLTSNNELGDKLANWKDTVPVKALNQLSSSRKTPYFAQPFEYKVELPYLAEKVSEAEKQIQAAERKFFSSMSPEGKAAEAKQVAEKAATEAAAKFEEAQKVAAEKMALETAAMEEKAAWDKVVLEKAAEEKAQEEAAAAEQVAAVQAQAEEKLEVAMAAVERAETALAAATELEAERASAFLAEESASAEELHAGEKMVAALKQVEETAAEYGAKAADLKSATEKAITAAASTTAPMVNRIISGKAGILPSSTVLSSLLNGPGLKELFESNRPGATASLVTAAVAAVGSVLRFREEKKEGFYDKKESSKPQTSSSSTGPLNQATAKGSYSPFGSKKTTSRSSSDSSSLYAPPSGPPSSQSTTIPPAPAKVTGKPAGKPKAKIPPPPPPPRAKVASIPPAPPQPMVEKPTTAYGSYLENLSGSGSGSMKPSSYSPFGSKKMTSSNDSLYAPPAAAAAASVNEYISVTSAAASVPPPPPPAAPVADETSEPKTEERSNGTYLDNLSGGANSASPVPSSYAPFGSVYKTTASSNSLYAPPESSTSSAAASAAPKVVDSPPTTIQEDTTAQPVEANAPPAAYGSYLEILSGTGGSPKASSYSPFGRSLDGGSSSSNDSLYSPPATLSYEKDEPILASPAAPSHANGSNNGSAKSNGELVTPNGASYLEALSGAAPSSSRSSYSPFGTMKLSSGAVASSSTLYDPPPVNGKMNGASQNAAAAAAAVVVVDDRIRTAYGEWCQYYGKANAVNRMEIFAQNFQTAEEFYESSGTALMLNEYADLTLDEYEALAERSFQ